MEEEIEVNVLNKLLSVIEDIKNGLDPDLLADWYRIIESESKNVCPSDLSSTIVVKQDSVLPMKFELKASKRAVPFIIETIENHLNDMPFATRLYFQKLEEVMTQEIVKPPKHE